MQLFTWSVLLIMGIIMPETCRVNENKHLYLWHLVGSFLSYINDAQSHEPKEYIFYCDLTLTTPYSLSHCYWTSRIFRTVHSCLAFRVIRTWVKLEHIKNSSIYFTLVTRRAVGWGTALQAGMASFEFFIGVILPAAVLHLGWLGRCVRLTTLLPS